MLVKFSYAHLHITKFGAYSTSIFLQRKKFYKGGGVKRGPFSLVLQNPKNPKKIHSFFSEFYIFHKNLFELDDYMINLLLILNCYWRGEMWRFYVNSPSVFVPRNVSIFLGFTDKIDFSLIRFHQKGKSKNPLPQWNNNNDDDNSNNNNNNSNISEILGNTRLMSNGA